MVSLLRKIAGDNSEKAAERIRPIVSKINDLEEATQQLSDSRMLEKTAEFRARLKDGETLDDLLVEAFALVREAARRNIGQRHYDVQLIGGVVLHRGQIAEMKTGEGKTLVATLSVYLNAPSRPGGPPGHR